MRRDDGGLREEIERGVRGMGDLHPNVGSAGEGDLTDIDGVGPSTAEALRRAEVERPVDLQGKTTEELAAIDGIGPVLAEKIVTQVEYSRPEDTKRAIVSGGEDEDEPELHGHVYRKSRKVGLDVEGEADPDDPSRRIGFHAGGDVGVLPGTVGVEGEDMNEARRHMADRSPEERQADRNHNAPITLDVEYWRQHDHRVDYPGVDTIPKSRRRERALEKVDKAVEDDAIREFKTTESATSSYVSGIRRMSLGDDGTPESTFAHELGHAVDSQLSDPHSEGKASHDLFEDEDAREQAERLSERRRGEPIEDTKRMYETDPFEDIDEGFLSGASKDYPFEEELFADVFATMAVEPRAAEREAPEAVREVRNIVAGTGWLP